MWALRHAGCRGLRIHALVASMEGTPFAGRTVLHWYVRARTRSVGQALGRPALVVSDSLRPVIQALRHNEQVLAAVDVPSDQVSASVPICLRGMAARVPKGLLRLAVDYKVPVTVYVTGLSTHNGQRFLHIVQLGVWDDLDALVAAVFGHLENALCQDAAAWHFWSESHRFFDAPPH